MGFKIQYPSRWKGMHLFSASAFVGLITILATLIVMDAQASNLENVTANELSCLNCSVVGDQSLAERQERIFSAKAETAADAVISSFINQYHPAGVTLAIVKDGKPIVLRGYGTTLSGGDKAINPKTDLFRIGSISKTFTWVAIMQLVEEGKLDLNENVNTYLTSFQLPEPFGASLTLKDIMAHRSGFEDSAAGHLFKSSPDGVISIEEYLKKRIPKQINPPGTVVSYSNYASALAGLIVEEVSGIPFDEYVEDHIFVPLEMSHTTFREPLGPEHHVTEMRDALKPYIVPGHVPGSGPPVVIEEEYIASIGPAGSARSTAADMANYMLALLGDGRFLDKKILEEETVAAMRKRSFNDRPEMRGFAHGFFHGEMHGLEYFGHGGGTSGFYSIMEFVPEKNFGVFISTNTTVSFEQFRDLPRILVRALFEAELPTAKPNEFELAAGQASKFSGLYLNNRRNITKLEAMLAFFFPNTRATITVDREGRLIRRLGGAVSTWKAVGPNAFQNVVEPDDVMVFVKTEHGEFIRFNHEAGHLSFERADIWDTTDPLWLVAAFLLLLAIIILVRACLRMLKGKKQPRSPYSWLLLASATASVIVILAGGYSLIELFGAGLRATYDFPLPAMKFFLNVVLASAVLWSVSASSIIPAWFSGDLSLRAKAKQTVFGLLCLVFLVLLWQWNIVGHHY